MEQLTLKHLSLRDWGPIGEAELDFPDSGVIALSGECGKGKSHIIEAIKMTCSPFMPWDGSARETERSMGEFVRNGADKAVVEAVYRAGGDELTVRRTISLGSNQPTAELIASGNAPKARCSHMCEFRGEKQTKEPLVTPTILKLFGLENPAQVAAVIVEQDRAGALWRMPKAERLRDFQLLSGAERLISLNKYATGRADHFKPVDYTEDRIKADQEARLLRGRIEELEAAILSNAEAEHCRTEAERLRRVLAENDARKNAAGARERAKAELNGLIAEAERIAADKASAEAALRELMARPLCHDANALAEAQRVVSEYERGRATAAEIDRVDAEIRSLDARLATPGPRPLEEASREIAEMERQFSEYKSAFMAARASLGKYGESGKCPVCGSDGVCGQCGHRTFDLAESVARWKADEAKYMALLDGLNGQLTLKKSELDGLRRQWDERGRTQSALAELRSRREGLASAAILVSEEAIASARNVIQVQNDHKTADGNLLDARRKAELAMNAAVRAWDAKVAEMGARKAILDTATEAPMPQTEEDDARAEVNRLSAMSEANGIVAGKLEATREALKSAEERVAALEAKIEASEKIAAAAGYLADLRAASHPNALPRVMAGEYVERLNRLLAGYCAQLKLPFTLELNLENLLLMLRSEDITAPAAKYTSRGQFTMAAWAWTLALYHMHGNRCGFLALDEPNTGLDANYRASVNELLANMGEHFRNRGLQMIIVSHDLDLRADVSLSW